MRLPFLVLILVLACAPGAWGAIAKDNTSLSAVGATVASLSWSHTVGAGCGANCILLVSIGGNDNGAGNNCNVTGGANGTVTYGGTTLTLETFASDSGADNRSSIWYMLAPPTGTATVTVTFQGTCQNAQAGAISLSGVNQTTPFDGTFSGTSTSGSITTTVANDWIVDAASVGTLNSGRISGVGAGQTSIYPSAFNSTQEGSYAGPLTAGSNTVSFTASGFTQQSYCGAALKPAATLSPGSATWGGPTTLQ